jgi:hypothetical protein
VVIKDEYYAKQDRVDEGNELMCLEHIEGFYYNKNDYKNKKPDKTDSRQGSTLHAESNFSTFSNL